MRKDVKSFLLSPIMLKRQYKLACAHKLCNQGGKCVNWHGHNYSIEISILAEPDPETLMVLDTYELDIIWDVVIDAKHDHNTLNLTMDSDNPTMEYMAWYIYNELKPHIPALKKVDVWETDKAHAVYAP